PPRAIAEADITGVGAAIRWLDGEQSIRIGADLNRALRIRRSEAKPARPVNADKRQWIAVIEVILRLKVQATVHRLDDMAGIAGGAVAEGYERPSAPDAQGILRSPDIQPA